MEIWQSVVATANAAANAAGKRISAIGIANQRETTVVWDRKTGAPVSNANVWQCRRTADICEQLIAADLSDYVTQKRAAHRCLFFRHKTQMDTRQHSGRQAARKTETFFRYSRFMADSETDRRKSACHGLYQRCANDAVRYLRAQMDEHLCHALDIPMHMLPEVMPSSGIFGTCSQTVRAAHACRCACRRRSGRSAGSSVRPGLL